MNSLSDKIKNKLKNLKPKPKWQFLSLAVFKDLGLVVLLLLIILTSGILIYIITHFNPWEFLPNEFRFHMRGFLNLPWELVGLLIILFLLINFLVKKVHFIYRQNNILIVGIILLLVFGGYMIAESTGLNQIISNKPVAKDIYQKQGMFLRGDQRPMVIGEIKEIKDGKYIVVDTIDNKEWKVLIDDDTKYQKNQEFEVGDVIIIIGEKDDGTIKAFGIKKMEEDFRGFKFGPPPEPLSRPEVRGDFNFQKNHRFIQ